MYILACWMLSSDGWRIISRFEEISSFYFLFTFSWEIETWCFLVWSLKVKTFTSKHYLQPTHLRTKLVWEKSILSTYQDIAENISIMTYREPGFVGGGYSSCLLLHLKKKMSMLFLSRGKSGLMLIIQRTADWWCILLVRQFVDVMALDWNYEVWWKPKARTSNHFSSRRSGVYENYVSLFRQAPYSRIIARLDHGLKRFDSEAFYTRNSIPYHKIHLWN